MATLSSRRQAAGFTRFKERNNLSQHKLCGNESAVSDINANCFAVERPMQHNSAKPNSRKSLYENTSRNGVFNLPLETKYDTSYWLSETEALLNRLCQELDVDTTGEKGARFSLQRDTSQGREKYAYGCNGRETIL